MNYSAFYQRPLEDRDRFWREQAERIEWHKPFDRVCNDDHPSFAKWFEGGQTNLCHNAVDRHVPCRPDQPALICVCADTEQTISYGQLFVEVQRMAAILHNLGIGRGDRLLIYMPMMPEAVIAMLAAVRLGAIHSVVFGGFASHALARLIDEARPAVIVTADAGFCDGKVMAYKPLLDEALNMGRHRVRHVLRVNRKVDRNLAPATLLAPRDVDYHAARREVLDALIPCEWVESDHPSYMLYTNGATGKPEGVQLDTGGYAVALSTSMSQIYDGRAGETFMCTSDTGRVVRHSYTVYGPLLAGMSTIICEDLPTRPDVAIWWPLVEKYQVSVMFAAPTLIGEPEKQGPDCLKHLFLTGREWAEPRLSPDLFSLPSGGSCLAPAGRFRFANGGR